MGAFLAFLYMNFMYEDRFSLIKSRLKMSDAFYGAQRSPFRFRTAAFRNETVVYTTVFIQVNGKG